MQFQLLLKNETWESVYKDKDMWELPHSLQLGPWEVHRTPANNRSRDWPTEYVSANHSARSYQATGIYMRVLAPTSQKNSIQMDDDSFTEWDGRVIPTQWFDSS
jgi:hypothetical protein